MKIDAAFLRLLDMSFTAGWIVIALVILRPLLKKAPKALQCGLWALAGMRLIWPFSVESMLSLLPRTGSGNRPSTLVSTVLSGSGGEMAGGALEVLSPAPWQMTQPSPPVGGEGVSPAFVAAIVWLVGACCMLLFALVSYLRLRARVRECLKTGKNVYICDRIAAPFVLGVFRPRIFIPSEIRQEDLEYVLAHERAHIRRRDHIWKPFGFALLGVYWFNPLLWVAYILLCRDIELACDEKVIKEIGDGKKAAYSQALINCSVPRKMITACPVAFGEIGVKERIKTVLSYKKPALWVIIAAALLCAVLTVGFLTNPKDEENKKGQDTLSGEQSKNELTAGDGWQGDATENQLSERVLDLSYEEKITKLTFSTVRDVLEIGTGRSIGIWASNAIFARCSYSSGVPYGASVPSWKGSDSYSYEEWMLSYQELTKIRAWMLKATETLEPTVMNRMGVRTVTFTHNGKSFDYLEIGSGEKRKQYIASEYGVFRVQNEEPFPVQYPTKGDLTFEELKLAVRNSKLSKEDMCKYVHQVVNGQWRLFIDDSYYLEIWDESTHVAFYLCTLRDQKCRLELQQDGDPAAIDAFLEQTKDLPWPQVEEKDPADAYRNVNALDGYPPA